MAPFPRILFRAAVLAALVPLSACAGAPRGPLPAEEPPPVDLPRPAAIEIPTGDAYETIARAEYLRLNEPVLELLEDSDPRVRVRAVQALGRIGERVPPGESGISHNSVARLLVRALKDEDVEVRRAAAFALGLNGYVYGTQQLLGAALSPEHRDPDPEVRALAIEAAFKLERPEVRATLAPDYAGEPSRRALMLGALFGPDALVRRAAAVGPHAWPTDDVDAEEVDRALVDRLAVEEDPEVVWRILFSLQRRRSEAARAAFLEHAASDDPRARIFAVKGLASLEPRPEVEEALIAATADDDWRVVCEALTGLGRSESDRFWKRSRGILEHPDHNVRRAAWAAWGSLPPEAIDWQRESPGIPESYRLREPSDAVLAEAWRAVLRFWGQAPEERDRARLSLEAPPGWYREANATVRAGVARGFAFYPTDEAVPVLVELSADPERRVAEAAILGLGRHPTPESRRRLHELLAHPDNGIRLAAVMALEEMPAPSDLPHLEAAWNAVEGDIAREVRFNVLRQAARTDDEGRRHLLELGLASSEPFVRRTAEIEFARCYPNAMAPVPATSPYAESMPEAPLPGHELEVFEVNPMVEVVTDRGTMVFELFPSEAPLHVHNFLALIEQRHYDDLIFHRVVPDFVIQGGDYRGDGNGGITWNGRSLPHEIGRRHFARGSLGMPRNDEWDSGGSQIFVTHRPTPHLDGRYTIFGELRNGFDVLDAIEVGDRIQRARRLPAP